MHHKGTAPFVIRVFILLAMAVSLGCVHVVMHHGNEAPPLSASSTQVSAKAWNFAGSQQAGPFFDSDWVQRSLDLDLDLHKLNCEIVAYRIRWSTGKWSQWFVPGVNDSYQKPGEPPRRYWACFNDHVFEIIYLADSGLDLAGS